MKSKIKSKAKPVKQRKQTVNPEMTQKEKSKFRSTPDWKDFRLQKIEDAKNCCDCCGRYFPSPKLHCHHKDLNRDNYTNITDKSRFSILCNPCHDTLHWAHTLTISKKNKTTNKTIIELQEPFFI